MNKQLPALMQKEMTRKEFLATIGLGVGAIMGLGSIIKFLSGGNSNKTAPSGTYGASSYGGRKA